MLRRSAALGVLLVAISITMGRTYAVAPGQAAAPATGTASVQPRAVLDHYCITCHNQKLRTAGVALDRLDVEDVSANADVWEKVLRKLRTREMPPASRPRPDASTYAAMTSSIEGKLDRAALAAPNPGRPALHRLNRTEYANAVRDLFAIDVDMTSMLPPDDSSGGFDNVADVLSISPLLLEQYMSAARKITGAAIGTTTILPVTETFRTAADLTQDDYLDGFPFGTRGGMRVTHYFPADAEYVFRVQLKRTAQSGIRGLTEPHDIEIDIDGARVKMFTIGGKDSYKPIGEINTIVPVTKAFTADKDLEVKLPVTAGPHEVLVTFIKKTSAESEDLIQPFLKSYSANSTKGMPDVDGISISGPFNPTAASDTPSRRRIFTCRPARADEERTCAATIERAVVRRAFRRPVTEGDVDKLMRFYDTGRRNATFDAGIELALRRILVDPEFIFRIEVTPVGLAAGTAYRIPSLELASRLSFFLWSSLPDDELLDVAAAGTLSNPTVLAPQVRRMLADPRADALVNNFAEQWLYLRNLARILPSPADFPDFDDNLREAFRHETELFFASIVHENRSVLDLLTANYSFLNERLARHYGVPDIYGDRFRRVTITDENRRGLLGQGSFLLVTSYATRTSPVLRGKWILDNILDAPPPPPPPNVPELTENPPGRVLTMRERMEEHRKNTVCASCHVRMDPIGLSLENFDAVGRWRAAEDSHALDVSGSLPDGTMFAGPIGLRKALMAKPETFVEAVTEKLMTYALGRNLDYHDAPAVRKIIRDSRMSDYSFSSILMGVIKSTPFQMRSADPRDAPTSTGGAR